MSNPKNAETISHINWDDVLLDVQSSEWEKIKPKGRLRRLLDWYNKTSYYSISKEEGNTLDLFLERPSINVTSHKLNVRVEARTGRRSVIYQYSVIRTSQDNSRDMARTGETLDIGFSNYDAQGLIQSGEVTIMRSNKSTLPSFSSRQRESREVSQFASFDQNGDFQSSIVRRNAPARDSLISYPFEQSLVDLEVFGIRRHPRELRLNAGVTYSNLRENISQGKPQPPVGKIRYVRKR